MMNGKRFFVLIGSALWGKEGSSGGKKEVQCVFVCSTQVRTSMFLCHGVDTIPGYIYAFFERNHNSTGAISGRIG